MINSKTELKDFISEDAKACRRNSTKAHFLGDDVWKYQVTLRKLEYLSSLSGSKRLLRLPSFIFRKFRFHQLSLRLGFDIPLGCFDKGLAIAHYGSIIVNDACKVGRNCGIHPGVTLGATNGSDKAPIIGNNVFISAGAKIIGDVHIADNVAIAANAVVVKPITEPGTTWGGVPAKKISDNDSRSNLSPLLFS